MSERVPILKHEMTLGDLAAMKPTFTVDEMPDGRWAVRFGSELQTVVASNFEAWRWIDRRDPEHAKAVDAHNRIRNAFATKMITKSEPRRSGRHGGILAHISPETQA
jgi:hypothetical protein